MSASTKPTSTPSTSTPSGERGKPERRRAPRPQRKEGEPPPVINPDTLVHLPGRTRQTFITSDFHLCHSNIIKYCGRPYRVRGPNNNPANVAEVDRMNNDILAMFDRLPLDCDVWNLGDVFYPIDRRVTPSKVRELQSMVAKMKGEGGRRRLLLVLGNHDVGRLPGRSKADFYRVLGFDEVYDAPVVLENKYLLSHEPFYLEKDCPLINLYGHLHEKLLREVDFCIDYDRYRVLIQQAEREGREKPKLEISWPDRKVDLSHYRSMCLDYNRGILEWSEDTFTIASPIWTE